eukprot:4727699-Pleurochrysis_carterae.AAC.2
MHSPSPAPTHPETATSPGGTLASKGYKNTVQNLREVKFHVQFKVQRTSRSMKYTSLTRRGAVRCVLREAAFCMGANTEWAKVFVWQELTDQGAPAHPAKLARSRHSACETPKLRRVPDRA